MYTADIKLGGKVRTVNFNGHFREALGRLYDIDPLEAIKRLAETWKDSYTSAAEDVVFCGLVGNCRFMRQPVDFTVQDVSIWLESANDADLAPALKVFFKSQEDRPLFHVEQLAQIAENQTKKKSRIRGKT
jgi:hypothetical protein